MTDDEPTGPRPEEFTPARATLWMLAAFFLYVLSVQALAGLRHGRLDHVTGGIAGAAVFLFVSALLVGRYPAGPAVADALGLRRVPILAAPLGLTIGALWLIAMQGLVVLQERIVPSREEELAEKVAALTPQGPLHALALLGVLVFLVPFGEEAFFRGAVYGALRRAKNSVVVSSVAVALGFTLAHADVRMLIPLGSFAAVLAVLRAQSGSLVPALCAHMGFNGVTVLANIFSWDVELAPLHFLGAGALSIFFLALFSRLVSKNPVTQAARQLDSLVPEMEEATDAPI